MCAVVLPGVVDVFLLAENRLLREALTRILSSSGSVIPVLKEQLRNHQALTVTHPEVKRFFMIPCEAVALVLQAFAIGSHGDILVLEMGEPVRILDLARSLIRLSGKSEQDVKIRFTGLRDGEKLEEELVYPKEDVSPTCFPQIIRVRSPQLGWLELQARLEELRASLFMDGASPIRAKIKEIVPEYSYTTNGHSLTDKEEWAKAVGQ